MHDDELPTGPDVVRRLLAAGAPDLAGLPLTPVEPGGSSNALHRLGADLLVRLPRQPGGTTAVEKEARWGPHVGSLLPVPVPEVLRVVGPVAGHPERWSVVRWLAGTSPAVPAAHPDRLVDGLAEVLLALRAAPVPPAALDDPALRSYRAGPLADLDDDLEPLLADCARLPGLDLDGAAVRRAWAAATAEPQDGPDHWVHGDLLAENLLVDETGRLAAVLDLGGLAVGHPAVDLVAAWELLDRPARDLLRRRLRDEGGVGEGEWRAGAGWALVLALVTFPYYWRTLPGRCAQRLSMARAVLAELG